MTAAAGAAAGGGGMLGAARISAAFDIPAFLASGRALTGIALNAGKEAAANFGRGLKDSMQDKNAWNNAMQRGMQDTERIFAQSGQRAANSFLGGLDAIRSGNPGKSFAAATQGLSDVIQTAGDAGNAVAQFASSFDKLGPIAEAAGFGITIATEALTTFTETGGQYLGMIAEIGDTYLELRRNLAGSTLDMGQVNAQMALTQEIMGSGAVDHFDDVANSIARFQRGLGLTGPALRDFTETYAAMAELVGSISPTNIAGVLQAFQPPDGIVPATGEVYEYGEQLTRFTNIIRATGGNAQSMVDSMIRVGPAMRALGYDSGGTALFFGSLIEKGLRGQKLVYGMNQIVEQLQKSVTNGSFKTLEEAFSSLFNSVKGLQAVGRGDDARDLLSQYTTPANATLLNEAIQKGVIADAKEMGRRAAEGFNQSLSDAASETSSLADIFENVQQQFEAAISPVGLAFDSFIVGGGNKLVKWLSENQTLVATWAKDVAGFFLDGFQGLLGGFGNLVQAFASWINPVIDIITVAIQGVIQPFKALFAGLGLLSNVPGLGKFFEGFKAVSDTMGQVIDGLTTVRQMDISAPVEKFGVGLQNLAGKLPQVKVAMGEAIDTFAKNVEVEQTFKVLEKRDKAGNVIRDSSGQAELTDAYKGVDKYRRDASGQLIAGADGNAIINSAWQPMLQMQGNSATWEKVKAGLRALNIDIAYEASSGIITNVNALTDEAKKTWQAWYESKTKAEQDVAVKPVDENGQELDTLADTLPGGTVPVKVEVDQAYIDQWAKDRGFTMPSQVPGPPSVGGKPYTTPGTPYIPVNPYTGQPSGTAPAPATLSSTRLPLPTAPAPQPAPGVYGTPLPAAPVVTPVAPVAPAAPVAPVAPAAPAGLPPLGAKAGLAYMPLFGDRNVTQMGDLAGGAGWSTMKVPLALAAMKENGGKLTEDIKKAITESDNDAADRLWKSLGEPMLAATKIQAVLREAGDSTTVVNAAKSRPEFSAFGQTDWTLENQLKFMAYMANNATSAPLLSLMQQVVDSQKYGIGENAGAEFKGGWGPNTSGNYLSRQMGIVDGPGGKYAVAIAAAPNSGKLEDANKDLSELNAWLQGQLKAAPAAPVAPVAPKPLMPGLVPVAPAVVTPFVPGKAPVPSGPTPVVPSAPPVKPQGTGTPATPPVLGEKWQSDGNGNYWYQDKTGRMYWVGPNVASLPPVPKDAVTATDAGYWRPEVGADGKTQLWFIPKPADATPAPKLPVGEPPKPKGPPPPPPPVSKETGLDLSSILKPGETLPPVKSGTRGFLESGLVVPQIATPGSLTPQSWLSQPANTTLKPLQDAGIAALESGKNTYTTGLPNGLNPQGLQYPTVSPDAPGGASGLWNGIKGIGTWVSDTFNDIGNWFSDTKDQIKNEQTYQPAPMPIGRAGGGPVWGAGTETSDSIPAMLSDGEYVHNAGAVKYYGKDFMHAINTRRLAKFSTGGSTDGSDGYSSLPPLALLEWLIDKLSWVGDLGGMDANADQRPGNKSGLLGGGNKFSGGGEVDNEYSSLPPLAALEWLVKKLSWISELGGTGASPDDRPGNKSGLLGGGNKFAPGGSVDTRYIDPPTPAPSMGDDWKKGMLDALAQAGLSGVAPTGAPSIGMSSGNVTPLDSRGAAPVNMGGPEQTDAQKRGQAFTDFSAGFSGAAEANVMGTLEAIKNPVETAKAMGALVGTQGASAMAEAWKGVLKETVQWDQWQENGAAAAGGATFNIASIFAGGRKLMRPGDVTPDTPGQTDRVAEILARLQGNKSDIAMPDSAVALRPEDVSGVGIVRLPLELLEHYNNQMAANATDDTINALMRDMESNAVQSPLELGVTPMGGTITDGSQRIAAARRLGLTELPVRISEIAKDALGRDAKFSVPGAEKRGFILHSPDYNEVVYQARQNSAHAALLDDTANLPDIPGLEFRFIPDDTYKHLVVAFLPTGTGNHTGALREFDRLVAEGKDPLTVFGQLGNWPYDASMTTAPDAYMETYATTAKWGNDPNWDAMGFSPGVHQHGEIGMIKSQVSGFNLGQRMVAEALNNPNSPMTDVAHSSELLTKGKTFAGRYGWSPTPIENGFRDYDAVNADAVQHYGVTDPSQMLPYTPREDLDGRRLFPGWKDGGAIKRADGGEIWGAGTAKSDSIPAWLSNGEFVHNADAVKHYGKDFMHAVNQRKIPKFAEGGDVAAAESLNGIKYDRTNAQLGRTDCSGAVSLVVDAALGIPQGSRMFTGDAGKWLAERGFVEGEGGEGAITVYWWDRTGAGGDGHMAARLSNGVMFESGGSNVDPATGQSMVKYGASPDMGQWEHAMTRAVPLVDGGVGGGAGGGAGAAATGASGAAGTYGGGTATLASAGGGGGGGGGGMGGPPPFVSNTPASARGNVGGSGGLPPELQNFQGRGPEYGGGQNSKYQAADQYNPFKNPPKGSYEDVAKYIEQYVAWQESRFEAFDKKPGELQETLLKEAEAFRSLTAEAASATAALEKLKQDRDAFVATGGDVRVDPRFSQQAFNDAEEKARIATGKVDQAQKNLDNIQESMAKNSSDQAKIGLEGPPEYKDKGKDKGKGDKDAQSLGQGLVEGIFQGFGFPDVFGKSIMDWGIWKKGMGLLGYGIQLGQNVGAIPGGQGQNGQQVNSGLGPGTLPGIASGAGGSILQSALPGVASAIGAPGSNVPDVSPAASVTPAMTPTAPDPLSQMGGSGPAPGPQVQINQYNSGLATQDQFNTSVHGAIRDVTGNIGNAPFNGGAALAPVS